MHIKDWAPIAISLLAILISALSYLTSLRNTREQNEKWTLLNAPRIDLIKPFLIVFEEIDEKTFLARPWGYDVLGFPKFSDGIRQPVRQIVTELVWWDRTVDKQIVDPEKMQTVEDANRVAQRLSLRNCELLKHYQYQFNFANGGNVDALALKLRIRCLQADKEIGTIAEGPLPILPAGRDFNVGFHAYTSVGVQKPPDSTFVIETEYRAPDERKISRRLSVIHLGERNLWQFVQD
jgi:hypothetical protein